MRCFLSNVRTIATHRVWWSPMGSKSCVISGPGKQPLVPSRRISKGCTSTRDWMQHGDTELLVSPPHRLRIILWQVDGRRMLVGGHGTGPSWEGQSGDANGGGRTKRGGGDEGPLQEQRYSSSPLPSPKSEQGESVGQASSAALGKGPMGIEDRYQKTWRAVGVMFRKRLQPKMEKALDFVNDVSGWTEVSKLKSEISELEDRLMKSQEEYRAARSGYADTQEEHRRIQTEIHQLSMISKQRWSDEQFQTFQKLLAVERGLSSTLSDLEVRTRDGESAVDRGLRELMEGLRRRFHEEQLWTGTPCSLHYMPLPSFMRRLCDFAPNTAPDSTSLNHTTNHLADRIRMLSMWSTLAILTVNSAVFLVTILMRNRESSFVRGAVVDIRSDMAGSQALARQSADELQALRLEVDRLARSQQGSWKAQLASFAGEVGDWGDAGRGGGDGGKARGKLLVRGEQRVAVACYVSAALLVGMYWGTAGGV